MNKIFKSVVCGIVSVVSAGCLLFAGACDDGGTTDDKKGDNQVPDVTISYSGAALPAGEATVAYTASVATATGAENIKYSMNKGALPAGITLSSEGELSGKPTKEGDYSFTVRAAAGTASATADFTLTINKHYYEISYSGEMLSAATVGEAYTASVATATSTGTEAITYSTEDKLPAGLTLAADGKISGTPTAETDGASTFAVTASAADAHPVTANFSIVVASADMANIVYNTAELEDARIGEAYTASVATATGAENIKYSLYDGSTLPAGLTLAENGTISGTPTGESATAEFTVLASAENAVGATAKFSLFVKPAKGLAEYTFEAEYTDLSEFSGSGISGHAEGIKAIEPSFDPLSNCSNGYYVGWTHAEGISVTFVIFADEAGKAKLSLSLATEGSPMPVRSSTMTVSVNNIEVDYDLDTFAPESFDTYWHFNKYVISQSVNLKEGENRIVLTIADNKMGNGDGALGFMIDALYLETESYLSWTPHTFDPDSI